MLNNVVMSILLNIYANPKLFSGHKFLEMYLLNCPPEKFYQFIYSIIIECPFCHFLSLRKILISLGLCGSQASNISITWNPIRNAESQTPF